MAPRYHSRSVLLTMKPDIPFWSNGFVNNKGARKGRNGMIGFRLRTWYHPLYLAHQLEALDLNATAGLRLGWRTTDNPNPPRSTTRT